MTDTLLVFSTFANEDDAARVVRALVEERLIACGNLMPGARSIYRWQGQVSDVVLDTFGASLGITLVWIVWRVRYRRRQVHTEVPVR